MKANSPRLIFRPRNSGAICKRAPRRPSPAAHSPEARPKQQSAESAKKYTAAQEYFSRVSNDDLSRSVVVAVKGN